MNEKLLIVAIIAFVVIVGFVLMMKPNTLNPSTLGDKPFYIQSVATGNYLNSNGNLVKEMSQATSFTFAGGVIQPNILGVSWQVNPYGNTAVLNEYGYVGTGLIVDGSSVIKAGFPDATTEQLQVQFVA